MPQPGVRLSRPVPPLFRPASLTTAPQRALAERRPTAATADPLRQARDRRAGRLGTCTALTQWQARHGQAPASSDPVTYSRDYRIVWPTLKPWGPDAKHQQVRFILSEVERLRALQRGQPLDMRVIMYAGAMLGVRSGGHTITPQDAVLLLGILRQEACRTDRGAPTTEPDILRMVVAGLVGTWGPDAAHAVTLTAARSAADPEDGAAAQDQAVLGGIGIGMAWKGLEVTEQKVAALAASGEQTDPDRLKTLREGYSVGLGWLVLLEDAWPRLQGIPADQLSPARVQATLLFREGQAPAPSDPAAASPVDRRQPGASPAGVAGQAVRNEGSAIDEEDEDEEVEGEGEADEGVNTHHPLDPAPQVPADETDTLADTATQAVEPSGRPR